MLFGESTDAAGAHRLLGACLDAGVNFFDCAEMYPVPQREATYGRSEEVLGAWIKGQRRWAWPRVGILEEARRAEATPPRRHGGM